MNKPSNQIRRIDRSQASPTISPTINSVSIFQALLVADHLSFSRAAHVLGVRQSAVSRRVQALENELGVSLFERHASGVRLTVAGRNFLDDTRSAIHEINLAVKNAGAAGLGATGKITIGVLPSLLSDFLCEVLAEFRAAQPKVMLSFVERPPEQLIARIMARRLDLAFITSGTPAPGCDAETFWSAGIRVALPDRHPLVGCDAIDWKLLKDEHFVMGREATAVGFDGHASERIARIGGRLSLATHDVSQDLAMQFVALGLGLSLVSDVSSAIPYPGVAFRPLANEDHHVSYSAVWLPGNDNPALRRFLSLARAKSAARRETLLPQSSK